MLLTLPLFVTTILEWVGAFSSLGFLWGGYQLLRKSRKEREDFLTHQATQKAQEEAALTARLKDYQLHKEETKERFLGFSQQLERVADKATQDCKTLEGKLESFQHLDKDVTRLQTTIDNTSSRLERVEGSVEKLGEKLDRTSQWQNSVLNEILLNLNGGSRKLPNL